MKKLSTAVVIAMLLALGACKKDKGADADDESAEQSQTAEESAENSDKQADDGSDDGQQASADKKKHEHEGKDDDHEHGQKKADLPEDLDDGETDHFGAEFTIDDEPITLSKALEQAGGDEPLKVQARVQKVCKKKGCWFTLDAEDVDRTVRVRMKDYGFFVPRNSDGGQAVIEGTVEQKKISEKKAKHFAKDEGKDPSSIDEDDRKVYQFMATGVEITNS